MKDSQSEYSELIQILLTARGKSKKDLASALHMRRENLYLRLSNKTKWTLNDLDEVAKFFNFHNITEMNELLLNIPELQEK